MKTRRRFLFGIAGLLLLAVVMTAATNEALSTQAAGTAEEIITGRQFKFEIDGEQIPIISAEPGKFRCELKDATMGNRQTNHRGQKSDLEACEEWEASAGKQSGNLKDFTVTKPQFGTWRVEKHYEPGNTHLKDIFRAFANGTRKTNPSDTGSLVYLDREGNEARRINFFGFTPLHYESIKLDSRNAGQAATEVMEFEVSRVEYVSADSGNGDNGDGTVVVASDGSTDSSTGGKTDPGAGSNIVSFRLDLMQGGDDPAQNWYSISGGAQILHKTDKTTGEDQYVMTDPGDIEFSEVEVVGPFVSGGSRAELLQVLNTWSTQTGERFNATLEMLDSNQQVVRTINFYDCIPTFYAPPSVKAGDDSLLEERFSFKPERVEG